MLPIPSKLSEALQDIKRKGKGCRMPPKSSLPLGWKVCQPRPGIKSSSYDPAARCPAPTSNACVSVLSTCCIQRRVSGFAPSRGGSEHWGAGPSIIGIGPARPHLKRQRPPPICLRPVYNAHKPSLMNSGGTGSFNSTPVARFRPDAHPTRSRGESAPRAFGAEAGILRSVGTSVTETHPIKDIQTIVKASGGFHRGAEQGG